ncbi:MAG TPA: hypothetical protein VFR07_03145 [Mycobacteriales bacterium]|nr:hypothetical protein [Mycobacteriales bacterium]
MDTTWQPGGGTPPGRSYGRDPLPDGDALAARTGQLLAAHVPLSLLLDLSDPGGPHSRDLFDAEPEAASWLPAPRVLS